MMTHQDPHANRSSIAQVEVQFAAIGTPVFVRPLSLGQQVEQRLDLLATCHDVLVAGFRI